MEISDFPITQIVREINFGNCSSGKTAVVTHLETMNFDFHALLHFSKAEIAQISPKDAKKSSFRTSRFFKSDFT